MKLFFILISAFAITSCASKKVDLKSPCVSADGGPCERRPVNLWMM